MNKISIIIPILNEAETIEHLLIYLLENSSEENIAEILVVDGGSTDGTQNIATSFFQKKSNPKLCFIESPKGRAKQMNSGSEIATGNILYFLHADSYPPKNFDQHIINEFEKGHLAGCFRLQFNDKHWWLRLASWLTQFQWRVSRGGDQSQFITKKLFQDIGGFDENYIIYEDNILINELYKRKQFKVINKKLITSSRRYEKHGIWKLQYHFWTIYVKKWFGASPEELHRYYKKNIA
ncbi:TIGR04283 family arsenosugar biosynthesis glycosyltransferase [Bizionia arctica]|uniref:Glycosyl hydrolase n=1 Tax=Bizionia arctica TaxID=1495645 RepID=A0A917GDW8_9FLAO|nr:TIGR04283 family arsenosugar biosynthesis glycosyltransferase [Bizionia arctica]GGG40456.1 glycosyl hydrolase [Bizionia arctica]